MNKSAISSSPIMSTWGLSKTFTTKISDGHRTLNKTVYAVSDVSLDVYKGETLGLVGESGCGKTTLGRLMALFYHPSQGTLRINGQNMKGLSHKHLKPYRKNVQMVFQDPVAALNPRHTVATILTEPLNIFSVGKPVQRRKRVVELLDAVGLSAKDLNRYPHEFSGGQRQRITIARALTLQPDFIVADEPVSALDVSVQSQILNLFKDLKQQFGLTYLFISHDLAVVHHLADRVAVMYLGRIMEIADCDTLFREPTHPYTRALLASVPALKPGKARLGKILKGDPPSPINPPRGCPFNPRCEFASDLCRTEVAMLRPVQTDSQHQVACHHLESFQ
ncbi:MAG: ATP-binding cassette domain-containing protein [Pseudomonadales bacterium]|nr:ATP-binding cassette domain-containing protein [Pseudomonadales bacterium]